MSQISSLLVCRFFAHLHVHHSPLLLGFGWVNPDHEHPASAGEVGGGEEVALASADDEVVARLDGLALVEVEESAVDGGRVSEGVEVGKHLRLVGVGDWVGALHLLSADTAVWASCQ